MYDLWLQHNKNAIVVTRGETFVKTVDLVKTLSPLGIQNITSLALLSSREEY